MTYTKLPLASLGGFQLIWLRSPTSPIVGKLGAFPALYLGIEDISFYRFGVTLGRNKGVIHLSLHKDGTLRDHDDCVVELLVEDPE